jgi:purine-binding chemotaxis protein CheW
MPGEHLTVLVFDIDGHRYGIDTARVREIVRAVLPARLPNAPAVIAGVLNVRGQAVPLIDLRARFGFAARALHPSEVFVLVQSEARLLAFRADAVQGMLRVQRASIAPMGETVPRAAYAAGTALLPDGLLLLCDIELFLDQAEQATLDGALDAHEAEALASTHEDVAS